MIKTSHRAPTHPLFCQAAAPLWDINVASMSTWSDKKKTKIDLRVAAMIMTHKLVKLLCRRAMFFFTKHRGKDNRDRINWTSNVKLTLIYF